MDDDVNALIEQGLRAYQQGRYTEAVEAYTEALNLDPRTFGAYFHLAAALETLGRTEKAYEVMLQAFDLYPGSAPLAYNIGFLASKMGRKSEAIEYLERALALSQTDTALDDPRAFRKTVKKTLQKIRGFKLF